MRDLDHKNIAIITDGLGKEFAVSDPYSGGRNKLGQILHIPLKLFRKTSEKIESTESVKALDNISFTLYKGEVLGMVGSNGSGKSVLLKIISRVTYPTSGRAIVQGNVCSMLELDASLNPELTGRENMYIRGSLFGARLKQLSEQFDSILEMSEIGAFIDRPVKFYSSGMRFKLSFAIAWHVDPDILILDEVLSVSDKAFRNKCIQSLKNRAKDGKTVIIVSHDNEIIKELCTKILWINKGKLIELGNTEKVLPSYLESQEKVGK